jgi:hypothetical protein
MAQRSKWRRPKPKEYVRGLPVPEKSFLLLELFQLLVVAAAGDEVVDVVEVTFGRDLKPSVLLPDATVSAWGIGPHRRTGPHALGAWSCIDLLLVEGHPLRVGVRRQRRLGLC